MRSDPEDICTIWTATCRTDTRWCRIRRLPQLQQLPCLTTTSISSTPSSSSSNSSRRWCITVITGTVVITWEPCPVRSEMDQTVEEAEEVGTVLLLQLQLQRSVTCIRCNRRLQLLPITGWVPVRCTRWIPRRRVPSRKNTTLQSEAVVLDRRRRVGRLPDRHLKCRPELERLPAITWGTWSVCISLLIIQSHLGWRRWRRLLPQQPPLLRPDWVALISTSLHLPLIISIMAAFIRRTSIPPIRWTIFIISTSSSNFLRRPWPNSESATLFPYRISDDNIRYLFIARKYNCIWVVKDVDHGRLYVKGRCTRWDKSTWIFTDMVYSIYYIVLMQFQPISVLIF